ncbi:MAG: hypothetical protein WBA54_09100 [Acidaminobacteraceae bacterium]
MGDSYKHKFNVLEVFEKNDYQNILMGTKKNSIDDVVVINVFKKGFLINDKFLNNLKNSLANLIHIEENDTEIIAVTEYKEGISFSNFLSSANLNIDDRIHLIHQYLTDLTNYDVFDDYFTNIFVDENQIISKNGEFHLNELLILDKGIEGTTPFDKITSKISTTINKIASDSDDIDKSSDDYKKFALFIGDLQNNSISATSIGSILTAFNQTFNDKNFKSVKTSASNATLVNSLGAAAVASALLGGASFAANNPIDKVTPENIETNIDSPMLDSNTSQVQQAPNPIIEGQVHIDEVPKVESTQQENSSSEVEIDDVASDTMKETELDNILVVDDTPEPVAYEDNPKSKKGIIIAVAIALLAALAIFILPGLFAKDVAPIASFERVTFEDSIKFVNTSVASGNNNEIVAAIWKVVKDGEEKYSSDKLDAIKLRFDSEGEYIVSLKVQDTNGLWSEEYSETILSEPEDPSTTDPVISETKEKLDSLAIDTSSSSNVSYDSEIYRSGSKSIKLDLTQNSGTGEFMLENLNLEKNTTLSMWILSDKTEPINIEYTGYSGDAVKFVKELNYTPKLANSWDMVELKMNSAGVDRLKLKFTAPGSTIWIDDIDTSSYK